MSGDFSYTPQAYPIYAMVVGADRFDLDPELNRDPVEPISPAEVCLVVGWDDSGSTDLDDMVPVLAWIDTRMEPGMQSPMWPVNGDLYYELRLTLPSESERTEFAEQVAKSVQAQLAKKRRR